MSVYICQVSSIVCIPDLLLLRIRYNWVLLQNISDGTSNLYSDLSKTVRSMIRHGEQKSKQVTLDKNITVTAVMNAQRCFF